MPSYKYLVECLSHHIAFDYAESAEDIDCHEIITAIAPVFDVTPETLARDIVANNISEGRSTLWEE